MKFRSLMSLRRSDDPSRAGRMRMADCTRSSRRGPVHWLSVVPILIACGGSSGSGQPLDAPVAGPAVKLTVTDRGAARAGVHVYFLDAAGALVAAVDTGADGVASAVVAAGGSVTALDAFAPRNATAHALFTYEGVKPGDQLVLARSDRTTAAFTLSAPTVTGATAYDVFTTCGAGSLAADSSGTRATGTVNLGGCGGAADIAVLARQNSTPVSGLFHAAAVVPGTGSLELTDAYVAPTEVSFTYTNAPAGVTLDVQHAPRLDHGRLGPFRLSVLGGAGTLQEPVVAAASSVVLTSFEVAAGGQEVVEWGPSSPTYTLDLPSVLLPEFPSRPAYDPATARVTWSEAARGVTPDATITLIQTSRSSGARQWDWFVIAPYTPNELGLPRGATELADWLPTAGDTIYIDHVSTVKLTGGYDALRARTIDLAASDLSLAAGPSGRFVTSSSAGSARGNATLRRSVFGFER